MTAFWFTVVGGSGIFYELAQPGIISDALSSGGMPAAMIAPAFLLVTILFVVTTADSMSYTISVAITGSASPSKGLRVFWAMIMGAVAVILLIIGEGSIGAIQSFIIVSAIPVSLLLLPMLCTAPKVAGILAKEQFPGGNQRSHAKRRVIKKIVNKKSE